MQFKITVGDNKAPAVLTIEEAGNRFIATVESPAAGRGTVMGTFDNNKFEGEGTLMGHSVKVHAEISKDGKTINGKVVPSLFLLPSAKFEGISA